MVCTKQIRVSKYKYSIKEMKENPKKRNQMCANLQFLSFFLNEQRSARDEILHTFNMSIELIYDKFDSRYLNLM